MHDWLSANDDTFVCYCLKVTKKTIVSAIQSGNITLSNIKQSTKACTGDNCRVLNPSGVCCSKDIKSLIALYSPHSSNETCSCCTQ